MSSTTLKNRAIEYAQNGFAVFPLKPRDKTPLTRHGCKEATTNITQISRWWNLTPDANIGIATGSASGGLVVVDLDIDNDKGVDGYEVLLDWERDNGKLPETASAITGRGGYHYYYRTSEVIGNRANVMDGIDVRGEGGYVVAPPSVHKNGNEYEWEFDPSEYAIAEANDIVLKLISLNKPAPITKAEDYTYLDAEKLVAKGGRNDGMYRLACKYQAKSYYDEDIRKLVKQANVDYCKPPLDDEELDKLINSALTKPKGRSVDFESLHKMHDKSSQRIQDIVDEIAQDELLSTAIRYNDMAYAPWVLGRLPWEDEPTSREWTDTDDAHYLAYMESEYNLYKQDKCMKALEIAQNKSRFNPVVEHLESLVWDGKQRLDTLAQDFLGVDDTELNREMLKLYMFGAIARAYKPGCQFDYMLILVGGQGIGKSTFLRRLTMIDEWFDGNFNCIDGTAAVERLRGMWILEMSELLALKRTKDVESIKSFITTRSDNYRAPYARRTTKRQRMCVFAGTSNDEQFLSDPTGNRRFLPLKVHEEKVKMDLFGPDAPAYFEQVWAEAVHLYKTTKPRLVLDKKYQAQMQDHQARFTEEDVRIGIVQSYLDGCMKQRVCAVDVWTEALKGDPDKLTLKITKEIHTIMREQIRGWRDAGKQRCGWGVQKCYEREGFKEVSSEDAIPF